MKPLDWYASMMVSGESGGTVIQRPFPHLHTDDKLGREIPKTEPKQDNKAFDAEPPVASLLKSMLISGGTVNADVRCNMRNPITFLPILIVTLGCSAGGGAFPANKATINDVSVRSTEDVGYRVVSIDGKPCERATSRYVSVAPLVLVEPGEHKLSIEAKDAESDLPLLTVTATVEPGKRYRLAKDGESVVVVLE